MSIWPYSPSSDLSTANDTPSGFYSPNITDDGAYDTPNDAYAEEEVSALDEDFATAENSQAKGPWSNIYNASKVFHQAFQGLPINPSSNSKPRWTDKEKIELIYMRGVLGLSYKKICERHCRRPTISSAYVEINEIKKRPEELDRLVEKTERKYNCKINLDFFKKGFKPAFIFKKSRYSPFPIRPPVNPSWV